VRLRVETIPGVRAEVLDGNRRLRLTVDPGVTLVVRGLLGEPVLRFGGDGVWVNLASPTASADRITSRHGSGWERLTHRRTYAWHDHRLAPPAGLRAGSAAPFALPVFLNGSARTIGGVFTFVPRPAWWPWLVGAAAVLLAALVLARRAPRHRTGLAWLLAVAAAAGALAASLGFATADSLGGASQWVQVGCAAVLVLLGAVAFARRSVQTWTASLIGAAAIVLTLRQVVVFWHGVVISSLSPSVTRLAVAVAIAAELAAAGISFAVDEGGEARSVAPDDARGGERAA
jgi:FtsH-binding integral membrane protein